MVLFGVAGYPPAFHKSKYSKNRIDILYWLKDLGLHAFEMQMTYGPRMLEENCKEYRQLSNALNISLSIHAAYYIVLTSSVEKKVTQSIDTLKRTFELADLLGVEKIILHPGPLYDKPPDIAFDNLMHNLQIFFNSIGKSPINLFLETAGKVGQFGSVNEIIDTCKNFEDCQPCIDFGHVHARTRGTLKKEEKIDAIFNDLDNYVKSKPKGKLHFHYTPIDYGPRGEKVHKALKDNYPIDSQFGFPFYEDQNSNNGHYHPRFEPIVNNIHKHKINGTMISETHDSQEEGALEMFNYYKKLS